MPGGDGGGGGGGGGGGDALSTPQFGCQNFFYFWRSEKCGAARLLGISLIFAEH